MANEVVVSTNAYNFQNVADAVVDVFRDGFDEMMQAKIATYTTEVQTLVSAATAAVEYIETMEEAAETAKVVVETAQVGAEAAKVAAETARAGAEAAKVAAVDAQANAEAANVVVSGIAQNVVEAGTVADSVIAAGLVADSVIAAGAGVLHFCGEVFFTVPLVGNSFESSGVSFIPSVNNGVQVDSN